MSGRIATVTAIPSLKGFLLRSESLKLYREALRGTRQLTGSQRQEVNQVIRSEFETTRHITDEMHIKYLLTDGRRKIQQLMTQLAMAK